MADYTRGSDESAEVYQVGQGGERVAMQVLSQPEFDRHRKLLGGACLAVVLVALGLRFTFAQHSKQI